MTPGVGGGGGGREGRTWLGGAVGSKDRDELLPSPGRVPRGPGCQEPEASAETQGHG